MFNFNYQLYISKFLLFALIVCGAAALAPAQTKTESPQLVGNEITEFTYQGRLVENNQPANGTYDFQFTLTGGVDPNAVIATQQRSGVQVVNGIFTVRLDFGRSFPAGQQRFLEIGVKAVGTAAYTPLTPAQPITATPYAIHSAYASQAYAAQYATSSQHADEATTAETAQYSQNAVNAQFANQAVNATNATSANIALDTVKLGGLAADQYVMVVDSRLTDARQPLAGSGFYIQNTSDQQAASFNINGTGSASLLSALTVNAATQYSLGGAKFITAPSVGNTFIGLGVGSFLNGGARNSFFGNNSGRANANGNDNSFYGFEAGKQNASGNYNSFFGSEAGLSNSNGFYNSFFGYQAGKSATGSSGNAFFGSESGGDTTTGSDNAFFGRASGAGNTTGGNNAYFGSYAGRIGFTASNNAFFGAYSGNNNQAGENSFIGAESGFQNTTGGGNAFLGYRSGYANTTGYSNTFLGFAAGKSTTTGAENQFIGYNAGAANTTGSRNIFIGNNAGALGTANGTDNIGIGNEAYFGPNVTNSVVIGSSAYSNTSNQIVLGNGQQNTFVSAKLAIGIFATGVSTLCASANNEIGRCSSSIRYKKDVADFTGGLDVVRRLRPVTFTWKDGGMRDLGFIAEEVNAVEPLMTVYNEKGEVEGVKYDRISTALVNAVNEQQTEIESQRADADAQKKQIEEQKTLIQDQQRQLNEQQKQLDALRKVVCAQNPKTEICEEKK